MNDLILTTFDWVPEVPRGYVRDIRVRWALEEAGLPYRVESMPFRDRHAEHFSHQPFGQVPWLTDGDISIFESGAILLHLGERSDKLMPADRAVAARSWNGCSRRSIRSRWRACPGPYSSSPAKPSKRRGGSSLTDFLNARLQHMEPVLAGREWLAGTFSVADILMADVLRLVDRFDGLAEYPACRTMSRAPRPARPS